MIGIEIKNINDARATFATVIQDVAKAKEIICQNGKSHNSQKVSIISTNLLDEILSGYTFHPVIQFCEETKQHEVLLIEINVYSYADTKEKAEEDLLDLIEDYVALYLEDAEKYMKFENYRKHYPYVLRLAHCQDRVDMRRVVFDDDKY